MGHVSSEICGYLSRRRYVGFDRFLVIWSVTMLALAHDRLSRTMILGLTLP